METQLICTICGYAGTPKKKNKGNGWIEVILWFFFLIPGIIYSIWRRSDKQSICLKCGNKSMIPIDSPQGQKMMGEQRNNPNINMGETEPVKPKSSNSVVIAILLGVIAFIAIYVVYLIGEVDNDVQPTTTPTTVPVVQNLPTEPQARIESIIKSIGDYEITLWDAKENLAKSTTPPPYEVIINVGSGKIASCSYAKNVAFDIMKKLYTDSVVKDKISRVKFTSWGHLSVSVGGEDGRKTDWNSSGPTNFWTVMMKYKPYEDETGKLNQRTWGKEIANNCD